MARALPQEFVMERPVGSETVGDGQVDRRISIEEVFEHVIAGLRLSVLLKAIRGTAS
jgi:hypothetical protein